MRYEEVASGYIGHAIRVTFSQTQNGYVSPASHRASSSSNCSLPPMGLRLRLEDWFNSNAGFHGRRRGDPRGAAPLRDDRRRQRLELVHHRIDRRRWDDENLNQLKDVPGTAFEVVDTGEPIRPASAPCAG